MLRNEKQCYDFREKLYREMAVRIGRTDKSAFSDIIYVSLPSSQTFP